MSLAALLRPLGALWVLVAMISLLAALAAFAVSEPHLAPFFLISAGLALVPGLLILSATRGIRFRASALDALGLALLAWVTTPAVAALPFWISGYFDPIDSLFEAYSAVTTTGATLLPADQLPRSLVFWRAIMAWFGGYGTLVLAIAILAALDKDVPAIRRSPLLTIRPDNVFSHLPQAAQRVGLIYTVITSLIWLGLILSGTGLFDSTVLAMGAISTSGYTPADGGLLPAFGALATLLVAIGSLAGSLNIALFWDVLRDWRVMKDPDLLGISILTVGLAVLYVVAAPEQAHTHVLDALFMVTTSGYSVAGTLSPVPIAAVFVALIGGAAASTSGGIKVSRILLLWRRMGSELALLADPSSVAPVTFRGRQARDSALIGIWAYVLGFLACLGLGTLLLSLTDMDFVTAFLANASALANIGPLLNEVQAGDGWRDITDNAKPILISAMVLGRLEVLAAVAAIWALFIRN
ncbi:TrkH family potassium uptake protein [Maricaulis parjimensis]|uniref:TrkH family potassium uptake protein n=1 Tax=Maricaulis parjimensis TaxID=144023 RepID=UPI0019394DD6|nr:TrkH family potassium uptake protein [Maricaulis parjimensis]